jgi:hypothetical protein
VSHHSLAIYIKKVCEDKKEELWKIKYFMMQKYNLQKNRLKETKILQDIRNSIITNLKFQHKPKVSSFKNLHIKKRPIRYLGAKIPQATTLYNESEHNILA